MNNFTALVAGIASLLLTTAAHGQPQAADTAALSPIVALYHQAIGQSSGLYSGSEYKPGNELMLNTPFFQDDKWHSGRIIYKGINYNNVYLMYDVYNDQVIGSLYNQFLKYVFNPGEVNSFDIGTHHFIYLEADTTHNKSSISSGFYEQLYEGNTQVLAKYSEQIENKISNNMPESRYVGKTRYFIKNKGIYYSVSGNGSVTDALQDKKKQVQQFIKSRHIKIKDKPEEVLVSIAAYYDTLTD